MWIFAVIVLLEAHSGWRSLFCSAVTCSSSSVPVLLEHAPCAETTPLNLGDNSVGYQTMLSCSSLLWRSAASFDYCPLLECQPTGLWTIVTLSCSASECYNGTSRDYTGRRTCTVNGKPCQRWDAQTPHTHTFSNDSLFPDDSLSAAKGYCRDPGGLHGEPWCYTTDPATERENCSIPACTDISIGQGLCANDYCGDPSGVIGTDNACAQIQTNMYARNVNSTRVISCQSLLQGFQSTASYCPVQRCQGDFYWSDVAISCGENECYTPGQSRDYQGRQTCTNESWPCQRWDQQTPHPHSFTLDSQFPDTTVSAAGAYCRDPDGTRGQPWCYTTLPEVEWQFCSLVNCSSLGLGSGTCAPTVTTTTPASTTTVATTTPSSTTTTTTTVVQVAATTSPTAPTTTVPAQTTASVPTGINLQTGLYRRTNTSRVGFQKQYSVPYIKYVVHCAKLCLSQWMCVLITYDSTSTCRLYRHNPEVTSATTCHDVKCFIINSMY